MWHFKHNLVISTRNGRYTGFLFALVLISIVDLWFLNFWDGYSVDCGLNNGMIQAEKSKCANAAMNALNCQGYNLVSSPCQPVCFASEMSVFESLFGRAWLKPWSILWKQALPYLLYLKELFIDLNFPDSGSSKRSSILNVASCEVCSVQKLGCILKCSRALNRLWSNWHKTSTVWP